MINVDISGVTPFTDNLPTSEAETAFKALEAGKFKERTGWMHLPEQFSPALSDKIKAAAFDIQSTSQALVVIGIGGSYLGAKAALELLRSPYYNFLPKTTPDIYFAGTSLSGEEAEQLLMLIGDKDFSINVISKSGSTIETSAAFRIFHSLLQSKYGTENAKRRVYVTTDPHLGILRRFAEENGCTNFDIPEDIGGRYSVLTPVGLLPACVAGIDIDAVMAGALEEKKNGLTQAVTYAAARQALYRAGKRLELLSFFEPCFKSMGEWWKQLFGESEGKNGGGLFPACTGFTTDLHSLGQYIQDGNRIIAETFFSIARDRSSLILPGENPLGDNISPLTGKRLGDINAAALPAVKKAHLHGGTPTIELNIPSLTPEFFGAMVYFFELSCAISACMMNVNPFDQPGVEAYKKNLFEVLGI